MEFFKRLLCTAVIGILFLNLAVYGENLSDEDVLYKNQIGDLYTVCKTEGEWYVTDVENNIFGGPFSSVSDYGDYPYALNYDGSKVLYDSDGTVLAEVDGSCEIYYPKNGIYAVADNTNTELVTEFAVYDYETKERLFVSDVFFPFYLEQQSDKMFVEKDGKYALIDKYGNYLTDFIYEGLVKRFNPDYFPFPKAYAIVIQDGEEKYIDWDLNEIDLNNDSGDPFITNCGRMRDLDGADFYMNYYWLESGNRHAVYNMDTGEYLIPFRDDMTFGSMNQSYIHAAREEKIGLIDYSQNVIIPFDYSYLGFGEDNSGLFEYTRIENAEGSDIREASGYYDVERGVEVTDFKGVMVEPGIFIKHNSVYTDGYRKYVSEIVNCAEHNLTGETYAKVSYENGEFGVASYVTSEEFTPVQVNRDFAVIKLNGEYLEYDGVIIDDRTLVPMREIVESLGGTVVWDGENKRVYSEIDGNVVELEIESDIMKINGEEKQIDVPAKLINDKTMLPLRALAESVGAEVSWDERIRCVYIEK